jgi:hypothetical protein
VNAGLKLGYVASSGYDLFSSSNAFPQFSVDATYAFFVYDRFAFGAGLGWDAGGSTDTLRGMDVSLSTHRFTVPLEARYEVARWLWAVGKISPGAAYLHAEVDGGAPPNALAGSAWGFTADASLGAAFAVNAGPTKKRPPRFLVMPEVGYMVTTGARLRPGADRDADAVLGSDETTNLGKVALSGFFWRATVGVAF